jgi:hypothetical protein
VQVGTGKSAYVRLTQNRLVYADFWTLVDLYEPFGPPLQGGGRWFEPSIAHSGFRVDKRNSRNDEGSRIVARDLATSPLHHRQLVAHGEEWVGRDPRETDKDSRYRCGWTQARVRRGAGDVRVEVGLTVGDDSLMTTRPRQR